LGIVEPLPVDARRDWVVDAQTLDARLACFQRPGLGISGRPSTKKLRGRKKNDGSVESIAQVTELGGIPPGRTVKFAFTFPQQL